MLRSIYYQNSNEILKMELPSNILIICPSPLITDSLRLAMHSKVEVVTIAKWISSISLKENQKKVSKSELMLRVASAWRNYFPNGTMELFSNSFEIFTEVRSFTLDLNLALDVISELDEDIITSVKIFWAVLTADNLIDEQLSYQLKKGCENSRPLMFVGFKHLSAIQIDLLKDISEYQDVVIYFPMKVKLEAFSSDWINWIDSSEVKNNDFPETNKKIKYLEYGAKKLNSYLAPLLKEKSFDYLTYFDSQKKMTTAQELLVSSSSFKTPIDIFEIEKIKIASIFEPKEIVEINSVLEKVSILKREYIGTYNYLGLKVALLFEDCLRMYLEYHHEYSGFVHRLLMSVLDLNTPRNFFVSLEESNNSRIVGFDELKYINTETKILIILSKESSPFNIKENRYSEEIIQKLRAIGPLKRGGFDYSIVKNEFFELMNNYDVMLFIEHGMFETDLGIKDIEKKFNLEAYEVEVNSQKKIKDPLQSIVTLNNDKRNSFSPSRLQTYFDCPRKYYFSYLNKMDIAPDHKTALGPDEKGILEHLIIQKYFENHEILKLEILKVFIDDELHKYLLEKNRKLDEQNFNEAFFELIEYTNNALSFLYEIKNSNNEAVFKFEYELPKNDWGFIGKIDCLIDYGNYFQILDFKRSEASTGYKKDLENFEKLQLWIYALVLNKHKSVRRIGYVNVSDLQKNIYIDINDELATFEPVVKDLIYRFKEDKEFLPIPFTDNCCRYCNVKAICPREAI